MSECFKKADIVKPWALMYLDGDGRIDAVDFFDDEKAARAAFANDAAKQRGSWRPRAAVLFRNVAHALPILDLGEFDAAVIA